MTKDGNFKSANGNDEDDNPPTVKPSPDTSTPVDLESVEPIPSPNSIHKGERDAFWRMVSTLLTRYASRLRG